MMTMPLPTLWRFTTVLGDLFFFKIFFSAECINNWPDGNCNNHSGSIRFMASNNDCGVRDFDMEKFQLCKHFRFEWPVNVSLHS